MVSDESIEIIRGVIEDPFPPSNLFKLLNAASQWFEIFGRDRIFKALLLHILTIVITEAPNEAIRYEIEKKEFDGKLTLLKQPVWDYGKDPD